MTIMNMKIWQIKCHKHNLMKVEILADFPCFKIKNSSNFWELEILDFWIAVSNCRDFNKFYHSNRVHIPETPKFNIKLTQRLIIQNCRYGTLFNTSSFIPTDGINFK